MVWFAYDEATYITDSEYKDTNGQVNLYLYCYYTGNILVIFLNTLTHYNWNCITIFLN